MAVSWEQIEEYVSAAYGAAGRVERGDVVDRAFDSDAPDDVVDVLDAIGSRVFGTPDELRAFLREQGLLSE